MPVENEKENEEAYEQEDEEEERLVGRAREEREIIRNFR